MRDSNKIQKERKAKGLCPRCGGEREDVEKVCCIACRKAQTERVRRSYHKKKDAGTCVKCGSYRLETNSMCHQCNKIARYANLKYARNKAGIPLNAPLSKRGRRRMKGPQNKEHHAKQEN